MCGCIVFKYRSIDNNNFKRITIIILYYIYIYIYSYPDKQYEILISAIVAIPISVLKLSITIPTSGCHHHQNGWPSPLTSLSGVMQKEKINDGISSVSHYTGWHVNICHINLIDCCQQFMHSFMYNFLYKCVWAWSYKKSMFTFMSWLRFFCYVKHSTLTLTFNTTRRGHITVYRDLMALQ